MTKIIVLFLVTVFAISCAPKIKTTIISKENSLAESDYVLVIEESDVFMNDGIKIGTIKSSDKGLSTNCNYDEIIEQFKSICRQNGANILNIIEHKLPDQWSSCDRVEAILYKVPDYKVHEKEIKWSKDRKLTWNDFKGKSSSDANSFGAESNCGFGFKTNTVRIFDKIKVKIVNTFDCKSSWVLPNNKNSAELLEHEQLHFDLSQIYTRQLRKKLAETKMNIFNFSKESKKTFNEIFFLYTERQSQYDKETNHGNSTIEQEKWKKNIEKELNDLENYSEN